MGGFFDGLVSGLTFGGCDTGGCGSKTNQKKQERKAQSESSIMESFDLKNLDEGTKKLILLVAGSLGLLLIIKIVL